MKIFTFGDGNKEVAVIGVKDWDVAEKVARNAEHERMDLAGYYWKCTRYEMYEVEEGAPLLIFSYTPYEDSGLEMRDACGEEVKGEEHKDAKS